MRKLEYGKYIVLKMPVCDVCCGGIEVYDEDNCLYGVGVITKSRPFDTDIIYRVRIKPIDDQFVDRYWYVSDLESEYFDCNLRVFDEIDEAKDYAYETNIKCGYIKLNWKDKLKRWINGKRNQTK